MEMYTSIVKYTNINVKRCSQKHFKNNKFRVFANFTKVYNRVYVHPCKPLQTLHFTSSFFEITSKLSLKKKLAEEKEKTNHPLFPRGR